MCRLWVLFGTAKEVLEDGIVDLLGQLFLLESLEGRLRCRLCGWQSFHLCAQLAFFLLEFFWFACLSVLVKKNKKT